MKRSLPRLLPLVAATSFAISCTPGGGPGVDSGPSLFGDSGPDDGDAGALDAGAPDDDAGPTTRDGGPPSCDIAKCGGWVTQPALATARSRHTATLLNDGRVLIAGGDDWTGTIRTTEIFDPGANTWSLSGELQGNRYDHAATLLGDGRVLIAGGFGEAVADDGDAGPADAGPEPPSFLVTAEVWSPATGEWTRVGDLAQPRASFTLTTLPGGGAIAIGGIAGVGDGMPTQIERFDPTSDTWSTVATLEQGRYLHTAATLGDDRVFIAGGFAPPTTYPFTTWRYDPADDAFEPAPALNLVRRSHSSTVLDDGRVLLAGGYQAGPLLSAVLFNPTTNVWSDAASEMIRARYAHAAAPLADGRVLLTGGYDGDAEMPWVELFDPSTNAFEAMAEMAQQRAGHTATALADGRVLVVGGAVDLDVTDQVEAFTP